MYQSPGLREVDSPSADAFVLTMSAEVGQGRWVEGEEDWLPPPQGGQQLRCEPARPLLCPPSSCTSWPHCSLPLQATAAAVLPLRDENQMKSYLLLPDRRRALLEEQGGRLAVAARGALGLEPLLQAGRARPLAGVLLGGLGAVEAWPLPASLGTRLMPVPLPPTPMLLPPVCRTALSPACTFTWMRPAACTPAQPLTAPEAAAAATRQEQQQAAAAAQQAAAAVARRGLTSQWSNPTCSWA